MMPTDDTRRAEAERAWGEWRRADDTARLTPNSEQLNHWAHRAFLAGYLAGENNGYARALASLDAFAVHYREMARTHKDHPTLAVQEEFESAVLARAVKYIAGNWECLDPRHVACHQEKEPTNG